MKDAELAVSLFQLELEDQDTYLRLERRGNKVYGLASQDGVHWRSYEPIEVEFPEVISAGVEVINSSKQPFACALENLAVYRRVSIRAAKP